MNIVNKYLRPLFFLVLVLVFSTYYATSVFAGTLSTASVSLTNSEPGQTSVGHTFTFTPASTTAIKQINFVYCTAATGTCTTPTGLSTTGGAQGSVSGISGTTYTTTFTSNGTMSLVVTNTAAQTLGAITVPYTGITNPSSPATYYVRITTYSDTGSTVIDTNTIAFAITSGQAVSLSVDPSLTFTVAGVSAGGTVNGATTNVTTTSTTIPLGTVTTSTNAIGAQDLTVTTNAGHGYTVYIQYTAAPSNGSHSIADTGGTNAAPTAFSAAGTEAFGYTTNNATLGTGTANRFTVSGGNLWAKFTTANLEVAYSSSAVSSQVTRVGYQAGVAGTTPAGTYTDTVVLTATPTY